MDYKTLRFELKDGVARLTLNRPDAANALDLDMGRDLMHAAIHCSEDPAIRAVILTGAGKMFCGGGDLKYFATLGERLPGHLKELAGYLHMAISRFVRMTPPLVVAVNGPAGGAGFSLCLFGDLVIAGESAKLTLAYTRAGLSPDGGSSFFLPRIVGLRRALELALTNRVLSAKEAMEWGLVNAVVPDAKLQDEAMALAQKLASGATQALGTAKRLMHHSFNESLETQMELEALAIAGQAAGADAREGIGAFIAKRAPQFTGKR